MIDPLFALGPKYDALREQVDPLFFMARDKGLQTEAVSAIVTFQNEVEGERLRAILEKNEQAANTLLGLGLILSSMAKEMQMFIHLKDNESEQAWNCLIDAQDQLSASVRASERFTNRQERFDRLREMEKWFFPPQVFMSAGLIVAYQECSICRNDYEQCDHVVGRPYMGRLCAITLKKVTADHVAIVEAPANRRCRITSFSVPGGFRNRMTWVVTPRESGDGTMEAIIATSSPESEGDCKRPATPPDALEAGARIV